MPALDSQQLVSDVRQVFPSAYISALDASYDVISFADLPQFFGELEDMLRKVCGDKWETYYDCDNFAHAALFLAAWKHYLARRAGSGRAQGCPIGLLCFFTEPLRLTTGHAINVAYTDRGLITFEPQTRQLLTLTTQQKESAWLVMFT